MPTPPPASPTPPPAPRPFVMADWLPSRRALLWMLLAFVLGLLIFALVLSRSGDRFYRAAPVAPTADSPDYAPLPTPLGAGERDASGMLRPRAVEPDAGERPQVVEAPRPPPRVAAPAMPPPAPSAPVSSRAEPIEGRTPAPRYPPQALRRGERGTVVVRADIGTDGVPTSVSLVSGSGSRLLDRAAVDAVKRWRFRPATSNGQPTAGSVTVPIEFNTR